ncbi:hypothetical protein IMZ48_23535 [Candidatus Bathyarchaeota archaeon]|nr:hypothetical protein [Candidatus Bathyarchaeota archaeon]
MAPRMRPRRDNDLGLQPPAVPLEPPHLVPLPFFAGGGIGLDFVKDPLIRLDER